MNQSTHDVSWPGWETVRMLGRGSFGAVYEIQRDLFGEKEKAALKVISIPQNPGDLEELYADGYDEKSITSTFQNQLRSIVSEYSMMRKLNGFTNIVNCDDVLYVQHDDGIGWDIYIKMELLTPLIKELPSFISEDMVVKLATDLCNALVLCKKYDIIHRDIKPQNIFVSPNGDYKLGDFGIAKTVEKTMGGTVIGTYRYMAPEVFHSQPYGASADIYSLGLVLYWLLNERRMPFLPLPPTPINTLMDQEARHRRFSGEPLPEPAHGSKKLKRIVLKACAYDVNDRYTSAEDMLEDLEGLVKREVLYVYETENNMISGLAVEQETDIAEDPDESTVLLFGNEWDTSEETEIMPVTEEKSIDMISAEPTPKENLAQKAPSIATKKTKKTKISSKKWVMVITAMIILGVLSIFLIFHKSNGWKAQEVGTATRYVYYVDGKKVTGWNKIAGKTYYFNQDGFMSVGDVLISGRIYYFDNNGELKNGWRIRSNGTSSYYINGKCVVGWKDIEGKRYFFNSQGIMQTGWRTYDGKMYYFNETGAMRTGWLAQNGEQYYFDENGIMQTGKAQINGINYIFDENGVLQSQ